MTLVVIGSSEGALAEEKIFFDLPARPASQTLLDYAAASKLEVIFDPALRMVTTKVHGYYYKKKALIRLLSGTGLTPDFVSENKVAITMKAPPPLAPRPPVPPAVAPPMREITISTGTHFSKGDPPPGANVKSIGQEQMQDAGAATMPELLRKLTQNFGGGPSEDTHFIGQETKSNTTFAQGLNFFGLGSRATLILINGGRVAPSGSDASFFDPSLIPPAAIDHVEILFDGASAIYGSDAVGGVVNFITKDNFTRERYQGAQALVEAGSVTEGSQVEYRTSEWWGKAWETGNLFLSFDLYNRDALSASARPYASSDLSRYGGPNFDTASSNPGTLIVGGRYYPIPAGHSGGQLDFASLRAGAANLSDLYLNSQILPSQDLRSFFAGIHQDLGSRLTVYGTLLWSDRNAVEAQGDQRFVRPVPSSNPFLRNRPAEPVSIAYDLADDIGIWTNHARVRAINFMLGANLRLSSSWQWSFATAEVVENEYQKTTGTADLVAVDKALQSALNPFGSGSNIDPATLAAIQIEPLYRSKSELRELYSSIDGPLLTTPGGPLHGAFGTEVRYQRFWSELSPPPMGSNLTRQLFAGFAELRLPVFGPDNRIPGFHKLDVTAAGRYEHYNDIRGNITPRVGADWLPLSWITLHGSWGKSFRAPNPGDLDAHSNVDFIQRFPDAAATSGYTDALVVSGKNRRLNAEHATTGTAGITVEPPFIRGLRLSANYYHTLFKDRIQTTDFDFNVLNDPAVQYVVLRNPSSAQRAGICADKDNHFTSSLVGGIPTDCQLTSIGAIVDLRTLNLAIVHVEAIDFSAAYSFDSSVGHLALDLESTYLLDYSMVNMPGDPRVSTLNTEHNPINLKVIGGAKWTWHQGWIRLGGNYANSYRDIATVPARNIGSSLTFDLQLGYSLGELAPGLRDADIILNVKNIGDRGPPFAINRSANLGYDQENGDPNGRSIHLTFQKRW